jgi:hypothetical protein
MTSTMHKIKRMMRLRFLFASTREGVFRCTTGAGSCGKAGLQRFAPLLGRGSNQLRGARPICPASVSAPKPAGRSTLARAAASQNRCVFRDQQLCKEMSGQDHSVSRHRNSSPMSENKPRSNVAGHYVMQEWA